MLQFRIYCNVIGRVPFLLLEIDSRSFLCLVVNKICATIIRLVIQVSLRVSGMIGTQYTGKTGNVIIIACGIVEFVGMIMLRLIICMAVFLYLIVLAGCSSQKIFDPFNVSNMQHGLFENWTKKTQEEAWDKAAENLSLLFVAVDGKVLDPGWITAPVDASYRIPSGVHNIVLKTVFASDSGELFKAQAVFSLDVETKKIYRGNAEVNKGMATLWIEDVAAKKVVEPKKIGMVPIETGTVVPIFLPSN